jgi:hypothetical protein
MESNTAWDQKAAPALSEEDVRRAVADALTLVGQSLSLSGLIREDSSFVECSEAESSALASAVGSVQALTDSSAQGSATFNSGSAISDFATTFANLATGSGDQAGDGVTFTDLKSFVSRSFSDNAQIMQRIADKQLVAKRAQQAAEEEAARQKAEEAAARKAAAKAEADAIAAREA